MCGGFRTLSQFAGIISGKILIWEGKKTPKQCSCLKHCCSCLLLFFLQVFEIAEEWSFSEAASIYFLMLQ